MALYATIRVKIPDLPTSYRSGKINYSNPAEKEANADMIREVYSKYKSQINNWGQVFQIPNAVIIAFIATESGGRMLKPNSFKATGLMQVTPSAIWESVRKWQPTVSSPLPNQSLEFLSRTIPEIFTSSSATVPSAANKKILSLLEKDANFNIMTATILLRWLLERFSTQSTGGQLNKAMVAYNAGAYIKVLNPQGVSNPNKTPIDTVSLAQNRNVPAESRAYLYKMLGRDGYLSLIIKDRVI